MATKTKTKKPAAKLLKKGPTPYWWDAIDKAEKRGHFTDNEKAKASNWPDCACGKQCPLIDRDRDGMPYDNMLLRLGGSFDSHVYHDRFAKARETLAAIEKRSGTILATMAHDTAVQMKADLAQIEADAKSKLAEIKKYLKG